MSTEPLRVLIDGRMLLGRFSGVGRVVTALVEQFAHRGDVQPVVLCGNEPFPSWVRRSDVEMLVTDFSRADRSPWRRLLWEETKLAGWVQKGGVDLYHATWNSGIPAVVPVPTVLTIHDLIPWGRPVRGLRARFQRGCYRLSVSRSVRRATLVTAVSDYSRREACRVLRLDGRVVHTISNGVSIPTQPHLDVNPANLGVKTPFVLYVGGHEPRKNVAAVFRAMRTYRRTFHKPLALVLTGTYDALDPTARAEFDALPKAAPVRLLGHVTDRELGTLYRHATALVMLSTNEGFGLPALEAMAHGCPVVAGNCASLPEVVGDAGILVPPDDAAAVAASIRRLAVDSAFRGSLVAAGLARAKRYSWTRTSEAMIRVYHTVMQHVVAGASLGCRPASGASPSAGPSPPPKPA